jgi:hypothetical protein
MNTKHSLIFCLVCTLILLIILEHKYPNFAKNISLLPTPKPIVLGDYTLGQRTKTTDCQVQGALPDPACSPGAVFPNATKDTICVYGYTKSVRNVPESLKNLVYESYGITSRKPNEYEMDHIIPLELGGSNDIANLYPEAAAPEPGFHQKDKVENYLHDQVCNNLIDLKSAQNQIANDWLYVYRTVFEEP